jgi:hypothetical protein
MTAVRYSTLQSLHLPVTSPLLTPVFPKALSSTNMITGILNETLEKAESDPEALELMGLFH